MAEWSASILAARELLGGRVASEDRESYPEAEDQQEFLSQIPYVPMRIHGLGSNLAYFLERGTFLVDGSSHLKELSEYLVGVFECFVRELDGDQGPFQGGISVLGIATCISQASI